MLPEPISLASTYTVSDMLGIDRGQAQKVAESGLLGPVYRTDQSVLVERDRVAELAAWPYLTGPHPAALVVRVAPAKEDEYDDTRRFMGWSAFLDQPVRWEGVRGWWPCRHPEEVRYLVVVLCGFVVETLKVTGWETGEKDKRKFSVVAAPRDGRPFMKHRLWTPPGGTTFLLGAEE
ncbi:MAG TPA: hypothetical protein VHC43_03300 [Mycobacteriales bacterium]|nr:hypothetical protein [Mycobacteriales bacterium]